MTYLTVRQAAEQVGVSRQTMFRYIKEGKVSATLTNAGQKQIEVTELLRAFGSLQVETVTPATARDKQRQESTDHTTATATAISYQIEIAQLRAQLELKNSQLEIAQERISELKSREHEVSEEKNRLLTLIEQQSRLLTAPARDPDLATSSNKNLVAQPVIHSDTEIAKKKKKRSKKDA